MTSTLEQLAAEVLPDQPPLPAEAATDEPASAKLGEPAEISAEPAPPVPSEIDTQVAAERTRLRERIVRSSSLSPGMRDRLTALLAGEAHGATSDSQPLIKAADVLALLEEAIPPQLRLDPSSLAQPEHPAGEVFFTGDPNQMTDDQAERIAREQIARSPYGRRG